jgi:hypothetical protein
MTTNDQSPAAAPTVPDGKTTPEEMVARGWQDVSARKGRKTFVWRDAAGRIVATAQISHQGFAELLTTR